MSFVALVERTLYKGKADSKQISKTKKRYQKVSARERFKISITLGGNWGPLDLAVKEGVSEEVTA